MDVVLDEGKSSKHPNETSQTYGLPRSLCGPSATSSPIGPTCQSVPKPRKLKIINSSTTKKTAAKNNKNRNELPLLAFSLSSHHSGAPSLPLLLRRFATRPEACDLLPLLRLDSSASTSPRTAAPPGSFSLGTGPRGATTRGLWRRPPPNARRAQRCRPAPPPLPLCDTGAGHDVGI